VTPTAKRFTFAGGVNAALFLSAFVVAPKACEGGLEVYFWAGVAGLVALLALPFVVRTGSSLLASLAWSLAFGLFGAAVWVGGLSAANVRIICRLF
jgi:hypothetical protein